jgi:biotin carboxyl carrier protein
MKLTVQINGGPLDVDVTVEDGRATAFVGDRVYELEVSEPEKGTYLFKHKGRVLEAGITAGTSGGYDINVNRSSFEASIIDPKRLRGSAAAGGSDSGLAEIKTAMPGKVVRVLVAQGDNVEKGTGLVVVEAMKMQNELKSPKNGSVKEIRVAEGTTVGAGEVLVTVE